MAEEEEEEECSTAERTLLLEFVGGGELYDASRRADAEERVELRGGEETLFWGELYEDWVGGEENIANVCLGGGDRIEDIDQGLVAV